MPAHDWACAATSNADRYYEPRAASERIQVEKVICTLCGTVAWRWLRYGLIVTGSAHIDPAPGTETKYRTARTPSGDPPADPAEEAANCP